MDSYFLNIMRALAVILVINSHIDSLYPIAALATGGIFGNSLFFFVSGYGLYLSKNKTEPFFIWIKRRLQRIYDPIFVIFTLLVLAGFYSITSFTDFLYLFVIPTRHWFLAAIILLYIPIYFVLKNKIGKKKYILITIATLVLYTISYILFVDKTIWHLENVFQFKVIFYFLTMLLGVYCSQYRDEIKLNFRKDVVLLFASSVAFFGFLLFLKVTSLFELQFITHIFSVLWLYFAYKVMSGQKFVDFMRPKFGGIIEFLSRSSLQIYLVHFYVIATPAVQGSSFPTNLILFTLGTVLLAGLAEKISIAQILGKKESKPSK